jgi:Ca2+-binding RTX toxin-like protein
MSTSSVAVQWVQQALVAVENNPSLGPTGASRIYGILSTAMYDAWSAYEATPISTQLADDLQRPNRENTIANKEIAISYAAYRVLAELCPSELDSYNALMADLRLNPANTTTNTRTAAGIGNVMAETLMTFRRHDGSNQLGDDPNGTQGVAYSDTSGYTPVNSADQVVDIEHWQPLHTPIDNPNGPVPKFLTPHWGNVTPFALDSSDQFRPPQPKPFLSSAYQDGVVDLQAGTVTLPDTTVFNLTDPGVVNPDFIAQAQEVVDYSAGLTDKQKLIAEFWEDPGGTYFPPGHWMQFSVDVSARDSQTLDEDIQMFFAVGNAVMDAGIATWETKRYYDYVRPVTAIRTLGELGLIGTFDNNLNGYAIQAWGGVGQGTQTILASNFITYQSPGGPANPPFAEYTSGHSAFSMAAATALKLFTGSNTFGESVTINPGESRFEPGLTPTQAVTLSWDTFTKAAKQAGISRLYGGIHFSDGNLQGQILGRNVGKVVFSQTQFFLNGGVEAATQGDDVLNGTERDNTIDGLKGNDTIRGFAGNDTLLGSEGDDSLLGGQDKDILQGGKGCDRLTGGGDRDIFVLSLRSGQDVCIDFKDGVDKLGLSGSLRFDDLTIDQQGRNTLVCAGRVELILLKNVDADSLTARDMVAF